MPAVVVSTTDQVENVKSALGTKGNVTVNDEAGNEVAQIDKKEEVTEKGDKDTSSDNQDLAASEGDAKPEDKTAGDSADPGDEEEKSGKKAQKKIDKLTKEVSELREMLTAKPQPQSDDKDKPQDKDGKPAKVEEEPKPDDYDTQADYMKALSRWAAKEARKEQKAEDNRQRAQDAQTQVVADWKKQIETAKTKYKDWDDVMDDTVIGNTAARMLVETTDGAELAYYIAKHPEEAKQFAELTSEREVAMALGVIRAAIKSAAKPADKTDSKKSALNKGAKPNPITPLAGSTSVTVEKDPSKMNYKEYKAHREKSLNQRRSA